MVTYGAGLCEMQNSQDAFEAEDATQPEHAARTAVAAGVSWLP
jgi:hypothetical protein